jgi:leader peptidase (prepilin peptidase)/N-methyltransferase
MLQKSVLSSLPRYKSFNYFIMPTSVTLAFIVAFSLSVGSFLNVCIWRIPRGGSLINPRRSYCPKCENTLSWWENIPVLGWILLRGKCHNCKNSISGQYPLVELLSGAFGVLCYIKFGFNPTGVIIFLLVTSLIVITFIDLELKIIPNVISFPGMIFGLILGVVAQFTDFLSTPLTSGVIDSLLGFFVGGGSFYLIGWLYYLATKRIGLGGGDIKLMAMIGAILGINAIWPTIFFGSLFGAIIGVAAMAFKGGGRHTEIPFGPWLALGCLIHLFTNIAIFQMPTS